MSFMAVNGGRSERAGRQDIIDPARELGLQLLATPTSARGILI